MQDNSEKEHEEPALSFKSPAIILATWFGFGMMKPAPGTWGSLAALPFGIVIFQAGGIIALAASILLVTLIGWWAADQFEKRTGEHDAKMVVIDEVAGQWIALLPPLYFLSLNPLWILAAFALFRFFDILKPWPASYYDKKVSGATGVMGDDIIAGLYAATILYGVIRYAGLG